MYFRVFQCDWSKNDKYILSCSADKSVKLWNSESMGTIHTFLGHTEMVR